MTQTIKAATATETSLGCRVLTHPVLQHKLTVLRDKTTTPNSFRLVVEEMSQLLAYEATRDLKLMKKRIETPLEATESETVAESLLLISIMRAGNGMLDGMLRVLPFATVGHIGIYRDKFIKSTVEYYLRLPKVVKGKKVLLIDPLLATADTACAAIDRLKQYEVGPIRFVCLLAAPEGIAKMKKLHPDVEICTVSIERELDSRGYILPGLGDAGDRLYDTEGA
ncbi:MAG: uracil phosphoribosyltransferase [Methylotenera sp.]|nr:uracil phosphoribosyltransferase [Oligoflexia bacterium]